jgi:hypothetical protein
MDELHELRKETHKLWGALSELRKRVETIESTSPSLRVMAQSAPPIEPKRPKDQSFQAVIWCPTGHRNGMVYGQLRKAQVVSYEECEAFESRVDKYTRDGVLDTREFWGHLAHRIESAPPSGGKYEAFGDLFWFDGGWSFRSGTVKFLSLE